MAAHYDAFPLGEHEAHEALERLMRFSQFMHNEQHKIIESIK